MHYHGELTKEDLPFLSVDKAKAFFPGYYGQIEEIMKKVAVNPLLIAKVLAEPHCNDLKEDFAQSILYHLYPCYIPPMVSEGQPSHFLMFVQEIMSRWEYSVELARPRRYSVIDRIINGFNKTPEIACYVEKISIQFIKEINKCKLDVVIF
jgi:hypothetical protein